VLTRFRRKHDIARMREEVRVELVAFDCLHVDGEDLLDKPLTARRERLGTVLDEGVSEVVVTDDATEVESVDAAALEAGHEGVMLKNPESTYTPGRRGLNWLKRKPDVETLDRVVGGAEWGEGRRANLLGTFLLGVRDGDEYETVGKVATGITDETLAELTELLEPYVRDQDGQEVDVRPAVVFEVGYEEIQSSPTYSSGYALRFPRILGIRDDLKVADADTIERVRRLASELLATGFLPTKTAIEFLPDVDRDQTSDSRSSSRRSMASTRVTRSSRVCSSAADASVRSMRRASCSWTARAFDSTRSSRSAVSSPPTVGPGSGEPVCSNSAIRRSSSSSETMIESAAGRSGRIAVQPDAPSTGGSVFRR
jgi:hypothetical protein